MTETLTESPRTPRLLSLDAYRGFVMLAMASAGLGIGEVAKSPAFAASPIWKTIAAQLDHVEWRGCVFWDLIQPSFMFIVGVAMPFSFASRVAGGQAWGKQFAHALQRAGVLILLGIFLSSIGRTSTNFTFVNVLTQIGLAYPFLFLLLGTKSVVKWNVVSLILMGYWALFALDPSSAEAGTVFSLKEGFANPQIFSKYAEHWTKGDNPAARFDFWFLNLFPQPGGQPFRSNSGGYATLNFIPSMATMIFGMLAGELLLSQRTPTAKLVRLIIASAVGLVLGLILDATICPSVKRIWTPSWAIFSTGWTCGLLAIFYVVIEIQGFRRWAFPLVVVGANSIAMYVMASASKPFMKSSLETHLALKTWTSGTYGPILVSSALLAVLWLICLWMYRQKIFIKI